MRVSKFDDHIHLCLEPHDGSAISPETMVTLFHAMGIEKGMIMTSSPNHGPDFPGVNNQQAYQIVQKYPDRFGWFCNVDPDGSEDCLHILEECKEKGASGVGEITANLSIEDERVQQLFSWCEILGLPVLFHMSPAVGLHYGLVDAPGLPGLECSLQKFPHLLFIGHSQPFWTEISKYNNCSAEYRYSYPAGRVRPGRLEFLLQTYPNLYGDLSGNSGGNALMRDPDYAVAFLTQFQDRLLFGTDHAVSGNLYPLGLWLDQLVTQGKLAQDVYEKIVQKNARLCFPSF